MTAARISALWLSIFALLLTACAPGSAMQSRRRTLLINEDWIVVESANFELFSTLSPKETVELAKELELFRAVVFATTNARQAPAPIPTKIFAFDRKRHYNRYAPSDSAGLFVPGLRFNTVLVSEFRVVERSALSVIFHEYVHFVVRNGSSALYPVWYDEGFPEFLSSARRRDDVVVLGGVPRIRVPALRSGYWLPLRSVVEATSYDSVSGPAEDMLYPQSWALVHYLTLGREPAPGETGLQLTRYMELLRRGVAGADAFEAAFQEDLEVLDETLRGQLRNGEIRLVGLPLANLDFDRNEPSVRMPSRSEKASRLGELSLERGDSGEAGRYFQKAIEADPTHARAHAGMGDHHKFAGRHEEAAPYFRRAIELAPRDTGVMLDLAEFLDARAEQAPSRALARADIEEARSLYRSVLEISPDLPEAHSMLGRSLMREKGGVDSGLVHLERGRALLPSTHITAYQLARGYVAQGNQAGAVELLRSIQASRLPGTSAEPVTNVVQKMVAEQDAAREKWEALPEVLPEPTPPETPSSGGLEPSGMRALTR